MGALRLIASRLGMALLTMWLLSSAVFLALRLLPGDPAALVLGDLAEERERAALRAKLHLDRPLPRQYAIFVRGMVTGDLGPSLRQPGIGAFTRVRNALPPTARLAGAAVGLGALGGVGAALLSVGPWLRRGRRWVELAGIALGATPLLALAPVATYLLAVRLRLVPLPGDPSAGAGGLLFASGLLALPLGAHVARIGRAALLELGKAPFLSVARAKGASQARVWILHALPAASAPVVAVVATQLGALLGGAVVLERLFERPGLGTLILEAYASRDLPVLEAAVIASGVLFVATQTTAAAVHALIDPRARSS
ncbi:MAG: ABC transporter permease [Myxococcales bacterium]|nr:ABC transporter permease [Polyangiaceae bacterium]MDW8249284.1 ABC transporter permease [Myxococcales bacterium]